MSMENETITKDDPLYDIINSNICRILESDRVFSFARNGEGKIYMVEMCDEYFCHVLTKQDCIELKNIFEKLSEMC